MMHAFKTNALFSFANMQLLDYYTIHVRKKEEGENGTIICFASRQLIVKT